jgi:hypothetical protein
MSSSKNLDLEEDFAAGVYLSQNAIPSWWKNQPWLVRVGAHAHPDSAYYHHVQCCSVHSYSVGRYTHPVSSLPIYVLCGSTRERLEGLEDPDPYQNATDGTLARGNLLK